MNIAKRMGRITTAASFDMLARGKALEAQGRSIIHLGIGEPDFDTPAFIRDAAKRALDEGWTHYGPAPGLHKTHALQGPIDDAFLDPFLLVRPTGTPWTDAVNQQALRTLARFDRLWGRFFRGHPFVKDDKDVTAADVEKYHVVLFGDPGSNAWIAKLNGRLPFTWTKKTVGLAGQTFAAAENYPAMIYPNPLNPAKYVVLNTGLTIEDRGYNGDYGTPEWGDYAIVKVKPDAAVPDVVTAGLFDERWQVAK